MKNLLIALVILSSLVSCGKKNAVSGATSSTSALTVTGAVETQLGSIVDSNQFGVGQATYYETWNQYVSHAPNTTYNYGAMAAAQNNSNCHLVLSIFTVCSSTVSSTSTSTATVTRSVIHSSVNLLNKQNEIKNIINRRNYIQSAGNGVYYIRTTDNNTYVIDIKLPIQANPIQTQVAAGSGDVLISVY